jgi:hypothetical protein
VPSDELIEFYNNKFGPHALVKMVNIGKRNHRLPEHTLQAAEEVYLTHLKEPYLNDVTIGQMVHAVARRFQREKKATEIDAWDFLEKLSRPRSFRQKLGNWMKWGKWE